MIISVSTANLYFLRFEAALEIIKSAGFRTIELDGCWAGGDSWETARHIKGMSAAEVLAAVRRSGLEISAYHDMGGALGLPHPTVVSAGTEDFIRNGEIPAFIFHSPHKKAAPPHWWRDYAEMNARVLHAFARKYSVSVSLENMVAMSGYAVPLLSPSDMAEYCEKYSLRTTVDTSHYEASGFPSAKAAALVAPFTASVHLSRYDAPSGRRLSPGDEAAEFFSAIGTARPHSISIEYDMSAEYAIGAEDALEKSLAKARLFVETFTNICCKKPCCNV